MPKPWSIDQFKALIREYLTDPEFATVDEEGLPSNQLHVTLDGGEQFLITVEAV